MDKTSLWCPTRGAGNSSPLARFLELAVYFWRVSPFDLCGVLGADLLYRQAYRFDVPASLLSVRGGGYFARSCIFTQNIGV